nr:ankyrin-2-like [Aegilops tauschii subsp. strangulata]
MNPLLLASSCCGSWQALNYLLDREDAPGRSDAVPIQSFLELLEGTSTAAGLATQQQASVHGVEEAGSDQHSIPAGPPVGVVTLGRDTALHAVAKYGDGDNFMRSAGVIYRKAQHLVVTQNQRGDTPLHVAARAGSSQMVSRFIDLARGEDSDGGERLKVLLRKENGRKETALHAAVRIGNKDMVDLLMLADSELASYPTDGTSPLYLAILLEQVHIVQSLYDNSHGNLSYSGPDGQNALHAAVLRSQGAKKANVKFLDKCPNVAGLCDIKGRTFLHVAIESHMLAKLSRYHGF